MIDRVHLSIVACFFVFVCLPSVDAYNILVMPATGKSHVLAMAALADGIAARGHSVTILVSSGYKLDRREEEAAGQRGIHYERIDDGIEDYEAQMENFTKTALFDGLRMEDMLPILKEKSIVWCRQVVVGNEPLFERLAAAKFDLAVIDGMFLQKCVYLIAHRLGLPVVTYADAIDPLVVRVPWLSSFVPVIFTPFTDRMSFVERLKNTAMMLALSFFSPIPDSPMELFGEYQRYGSFRTLDDLMAKSLLWLISKDHVLDYPKPTMPHVINVGGLTVKRARGELSADLRQFVEGARSGVIVVSFGTMLQSFPKELIENFFDAFRRLDNDGYRIIWRLKNNDGVPVPDNVRTMSWLPQNDLLGHPTTKLFITHCGNNGQYEAIYHGVPMIGFPLFGDQEHNGRRLEYKRYGITMNIFQFTADELLDNARRVLGDSTFADRVKRASEIFRSSPLSPVDLAAHWIEHVAQFGGDHLRSGGKDLSLYAYYMLDIVALLLVVGFLSVYIVMRLLRFIIGKVWGRRPTGDKIKLN